MNKIKKNELTDLPGGKDLIIHLENGTEKVYENVHTWEAYLPTVLKSKELQKLGRILRATHGGIEVRSWVEPSKFDLLWNEYRQEHPETTHDFESHLQAFTWLWNKLDQKRK